MVSEKRLAPRVSSSGKTVVGMDRSVDFAFGSLPLLGSPPLCIVEYGGYFILFGPVFFTIETSRPRNHFHSLLQCRLNITDNAAMVKDGSKKMKKKKKERGDITLAPLAFPDPYLIANKIFTSNL